MIEAWKLPHLLKGYLTRLPAVNTWRLRRALRSPYSQTSSENVDLARYCYSVWLRHLVTLKRHGFEITGARIGELGPGNNLGAGLAALISGAAEYVGLDVMPFAAQTNLENTFSTIVQMYSCRESIPDHTEFPHLRPLLDSYEFPSQLIEWTNFSSRVERISGELASGVNSGQILRYRAPWTSPDNLTAASLDLIFSQAVLEHVDALDQTYQAMFAWVRPGGYASHSIDFSAHRLSPWWNGHWVYSDWEWRVVRGRREYLLNREPLSTHLAWAKKAGFRVLAVRREYDYSGLHVLTFSRRFRNLASKDTQTRGALLILQKPTVFGTTGKNGAIQRVA